MKTTTVNVRELKSRLSHYLRIAKSGRAVEITERGTPIGRIVPVSAPIADRIEELSKSGLVRWNGEPMKRRKPVAKLRGRRSVAELLVEDRE